MAAHAITAEAVQLWAQAVVRVFSGLKEQETWKRREMEGLREAMGKMGGVVSRLPANAMARVRYEAAERSIG